MVCGGISLWFLICFSLMANDVEHLFMSLCVICIFPPFFGEVSVQIFCPFLLGSLLIITFRVLFRCCLQILYQICLSANNFSQSVACLFIHLTMSFGKFLILAKANLPKKFLNNLKNNELYFWCFGKEIFVIQGHKDFLLCTLLTIWSFTFRSIINFSFGGGAVLGLCCCVWASHSVASLVEEHGL